MSFTGGPNPLFSEEIAHSFCIVRRGWAVLPFGRLIVVIATGDMIPILRVFAVRGKIEVVVPVVLATPHDCAKCGVVSFGWARTKESVFSDGVDGCGGHEETAIFRFLVAVVTLRIDSGATVFDEQIKFVSREFIETIDVHGISDVADAAGIEGPQVDGTAEVVGGMVDVRKQDPAAAVGRHVTIGVEGGFGTVFVGVYAVYAIGGVGFGVSNRLAGLIVDDGLSCTYATFARVVLGLCIAVIASDFAHTVALGVAVAATVGTFNAFVAVVDRGGRCWVGPWSTDRAPIVECVVRVVAFPVEQTTVLNHRTTGTDTVLTFGGFGAHQVVLARTPIRLVHCQTEAQHAFAGCAWIAVRTIGVGGALYGDAFSGLTMHAHTAGRAVLNR